LQFLPKYVLFEVMSKIYYLVVLFGVITLCGCRKEYSGWSVYYSSKLVMEEVASSRECPAGGLLMKSGLDKNQNDILDSAEVDQVKMVCHGIAGGGGGTGVNTDKQVLIQLDMMTANMNSSTPLVVGELPRFSIANYPGVDSVVLVGRPYIWPGAANTAIIELYNRTDGTVIAGSRITSNQIYENSGFVSSSNFYSSLPHKDITLGIRIASGTEGLSVATGPLYLYLYRK
jgi:hypothetical protein